MNKLKQGDEFTDKKGNEYIYDDVGTLRSIILNRSIIFMRSDAEIITLIEQGELIPVKPKTVADEMLEFFDGKDHLTYKGWFIIQKLRELIAKHEEKQ